MQGVAERKSTMPVLSNVLLAVDGPNALRVAATDLYLSIAGRVPAEVKRGGSVAVPAKDFLEHPDDARGRDPDHRPGWCIDEPEGRWEPAAVHPSRDAG